MSDMNGAGFKMNAFDRKLVKVGEIDLRLRQVRAGVFIVAAVISLFASTASASPVLSWMAGAAWGAFIVAIVVHRIARTRAMRLNWRIQLEKRLQNLRDLIPSSDLTWSFHTNDDVAGRSARRLIRDLDVVPAQTGAGAFASLFPFFLSTAGQNRFLEMLTSPVLMTRSMLDALGEVRRRQKAISFWEKRTVLRRKILRISAAIDQRLDTNALKQDVVIETAPPKARRWLLLVICAQVFFFGCWITAIVLEKKWIGTMGLLTWIASYSVVVRRVDLFAAYP
ncbi:MAG: hypothetical protein RBT63_07645, partial [Bdellovibrionales bacterium]|nr:hypothetical protein [Bdellovibrionales bacterium]